MPPSLNIENPDELARRFRSAQPVPHMVIDGAFDDQLLRTLLSVFPGPSDLDWVSFDNPRERKLGFHHRDLYRIAPELREFLFWMNSPAALDFFERLTGIKGLIPDPYFGGGALHMIPRGGFLKVHVDFNVHPLLRLDRRLNVLIYLNEDWREEYGGHLELWESGMTRCSTRIAPAFNRMVIFETSDRSLHGHPEPLACPEGMARRSISLYYYTAPDPQVSQSPHDTIFHRRATDEW